MIEALQAARLQMLLPAFYERFYQQQEAPPGTDPVFILRADVPPLWFPERVPPDLRDRISEEFRQKVLLLLPKEVKFPRGLQIQRLSATTEYIPDWFHAMKEHRSRILAGNQEGETTLPVALHEAVNRMMEAVDGIKRVNLAQEQELLGPLVHFHEEVHDETLRERGWKLFNEKTGEFRYAMTLPESAMARIQNLRERGFLQEGTSVAELGIGDGLITDLILAMTKARVTGYEIDPELFKMSAELTDVWVEIGSLQTEDRERIHRIHGSYLDDDVDLTPFQVVRIYPPMKREEGIMEWAVDMEKIVRKLRPGTILVIEGGVTRELRQSPFLEYIPSIDAYRRIEPIVPAAVPAPQPVSEEEKADGLEEQKVRRQA